MMKQGKNRSPSGDGHASEPTLHQKGMRNRSPEAVDKSTKMGSGSVNNNAVRTSVGKDAPNLGPRNA